MVNFLIVVLIVLLVLFILFKTNNIRTRVAFLFILLGVSFLLLTGYLFISGNEINLSSLGGVSSAIKTYVTWIGNAGSNIVGITTYAFRQDWRGDIIINNSTGN